MGSDLGAAQARPVMCSRLALGTVQFGLPYGVANKTGQVPPSEVGLILSAGRAEGMDTIDTAIGYGESESVLGSAGVDEWKVVTKLPGLTGPARDWLRSEVDKSLARLKLSRLHGVLLHRPSDLLGEEGRSLYRALVEMRDEGTVARIGYSVYGPRELDHLVDTYPPDIVQAPFNVFDQRLATTGWLAQLHDRGVEVHTRSAFLQGLLLLDAPSRPKKFSQWSGAFAAWDNWCEGKGADRLSAALAAVLAQPGIDRVVVGVDGLAQLQQILLTSEQPFPPPPASLALEDENLLNPARWNSL